MKRIIQSALACACLLLPVQGWAAIEGTPTGTTGSGISSLTWAHTCATGSVLMVASGVFGDAVTTSSVTYNGVTLTELNEVDNSGGVSATIALSEAVSGCDGASHNIVVTLSGTTTGYAAGAAAAYSGRVTSSVAASHRTVYVGGAGGGGGSLTVVDSQSGDDVVAAIANYKTGGVTIVAGGNARITQSPVNVSPSYHHGLQDYSASGANTSTSWTNTDFFSQLAVALIPSGGGGATVRSLMTLGVGQ